MIELDSVRKTYGSVTAVDEVSLSLGGGQFHCLLGPNGSGKTTLLRLVLGLTRPTSGSVSAPDSLGCGFQRPNVYADLTVRENLDVFAHLHGADDEWVQRLVDRLRLGRAGDRVAGNLSGGFARRLDLALALLDRPDYLLLDEPLGALDDVSRAQLLDFLDDYTDAGNTVLVSTHHVDHVQSRLDRLTVMRRGSVVFDRERAAIDTGHHDSLQSYYVDEILDRERADAES